MKAVNHKDIVLSHPDSKKDTGLWFQDSIEFSHGVSLRVKIKNVIHRLQSPFQEIVVFETEHLGRMLVIDGITMLTEWDEHAYHEMIVHVPLLVHPKPSKVLIIGGGDGGTAREVLKHPEVTGVHICEIDEAVINVCRTYLLSLASSLDDPRVQIFYEDGARFVTKGEGTYDVIIVDSTDPIGPGQTLFQQAFYENMKKALSEEGIAVTQCESIFLHQGVIEGVFAFARDIFPQIGYYYTLVPTYPSGMIGFFFCSLRHHPFSQIDAERAARLKGLKYYTPDIHRASFSLPYFAAKYFQPL